MSAEPGVAVMARGFVSALGPDARTCCAAARAGLTRAGALEYFPVRDLQGDVAGLAGHAACFITAGFEGTPRLVRLLVGALADLKGNLTKEDLAGASNFYLSIPDPGRRFTGLKLMDEDMQEDVTADRDEQEPVIQEEYADSLLRRACALAEWPVRAVLKHVSFTGHTGVAEAVYAATEDLAAAKVRSAVIAAVDSLVDEECLIWLDRMGRLKKPDLPDGLQPGEAAGCLLLRVVSPESRPLASIRSCAFASDTRTLLDCAAPAGEGLAAVVKNSAACVPDGPIWLVIDHNGEAYRAADWGYALVRLVAQDDRFTEAPIWYPAISFGDTGAASGIAALGTVLSAFERGYAPGETAVICSTDDGARRSAMVVTV